MKEDFSKKHSVKLKKSLKINENEFRISNIESILIKNFIIVFYLFKLGISFINFLGSGIFNIASMKQSHNFSLLFSGRSSKTLTKDKISELSNSCNS
jgi:uncharacterized membrane protein